MTAAEMAVEPSASNCGQETTTLLVGRATGRNGGGAVHVENIIVFVLQINGSAFRISQPVSDRLHY